MAVQSTSKAVVRRYTKEIWSEGNVDALPEILTPQQVFHDPAGSGEGEPSEFATFIRRYREAFPDLC